MNWLIIRIGTEAPEKVAWAEIGKEGQTADIGEGTLHDASLRAGKCKVAVLVPGEDVYLSTVELPMGSRKHAAQAIPFALEESLATDVDKLHFAAGRKGKNGTYNVSVVDNEKMHQWRDMLTEYKIDADLMLSEVLAVPFSPEFWSVVVDGSKALVRNSQYGGFSVDVENIETIVARQFNGNQLKALKFYRNQPEQIQNDELLADSIIEGAWLDSTMAVLAEGFDENEEINLLQGPFGKHAEWTNIWKRWRLPMVLCFICIALYGLLSIGDYYSLRNESEEISKEIMTVYLKAFPESKLRNPGLAKMEMEKKLKTIKTGDASGNTFLNVYSKCGSQLVKTPGFLLQSMRYKDGLLDLEVYVRDLKALDDLKANLLKQKDLEVELKTATSKDNRVFARLQIMESLKP